MLVKIMNYTASAGNPWQLNVVLESAANTPIDLTTATAPSQGFFKLVKNNNTPITITGVSFGTDKTKGEIVLTFAENDATVGDTLILTQGITEADPVNNAPYSRITNSASIDTGLGSTPITNTTQYILTPNPNIRTDSNYNFALTFLEEDGTQITPTVVALTNAITIQGLTIGSIKFEMVTAANGSNGKYVCNTPVEFKVTFYSSNNGTGEPITFEGVAADILSVNFIPA